MPDTLSSISYILSVKLTSLLPIWVTKVFISRLHSVWVFFFDSISTFTYWMILFVFPQIYLRDLFTSSLRTSVIFIKAVFKAFFLWLRICWYIRASVAGLLASSGGILSWLLWQFCASGIGKVTILGPDIWSSLCWVGVLFLGFCCPECDGCVLLGGKFLWGSGRCGHWGSR